MADDDPVVKLEKAWTAGKDLAHSCAPLWSACVREDDSAIDAFMESYPTKKQREILDTIASTFSEDLACSDVLGLFLFVGNTIVNKETDVKAIIQSLLRKRLYETSKMSRYLSQTIRILEDWTEEETLDILKTLLQDATIRQIFMDVNESNDVYDWIVHRKNMLELVYAEGLCTQPILQYMLHESCCDEEVDSWTVQWLLDHGASATGPSDTHIEKYNTSTYRKYNSGAVGTTPLASLVSSVQPHQYYDDHEDYLILEALPKKMLMLLKAGADPNEFHEHIDRRLVPLLLNAGADPNQKVNAKQQTLLHCDCALEMTQSVATLLKHGADPTLQDTSGKDAMDCLIGSIVDRYNDDALFEEDETVKAVSITHCLLAYGYSPQTKHVINLHMFKSFVLDNATNAWDVLVVELCKTLLSIVSAHFKYNKDGVPRKPLQQDMSWEDPVTYEVVDKDRAWVLWDDHPTHIVNVYDEATFFKIQGMSPLTRRQCHICLPLHKAVM